MSKYVALLSAPGEKSSRDERVACAMLATQLDNFLGGDPVQHRQVQGYESPEFMALFPRGVSYKVSSNFACSIAVLHISWLKARENDVT